MKFTRTTYNKWPSWHIVCASLINIILINTQNALKFHIIFVNSNFGRFNIFSLLVCAQAHAYYNYLFHKNCLRCMCIQQCPADAPPPPLVNCNSGLTPSARINFKHIYDDARMLAPQISSSMESRSHREEQQ